MPRAAGVLILTGQATEKRMCMPRAPRSSATRRRDHRQGTLPLRPPNRTGAQKVRPSNERPPKGRRLASFLLVLTIAVLVANAIVGERGLVKTARARREHRELAESIARLQRENRRLALQADRIRRDPSAVEALARGELGLIRPGEQLFIITDRPLPTR